MIESTVNKLDMDSSIGSVTLSDGVTVLNIPKLSMMKIIKIVKWLGIDGMKLYGDYQEIINDPEMDEIAKFTIILENLPEHQLVRLFSIALDLSDQEVLSLDHNEMLEIMLIYVDVLDLSKTFTLVRQLYKKIYKKDLPDLKNIFKKNPIQIQEPIQQTNSK